MKEKAQIDAESLQIPLFADPMILIASSHKTLQCLPNKTHDYSKEISIAIRKKRMEIFLFFNGDTNIMNCT